MNKKITIILAFAVLGLSKINAQNVGIGIAAPISKLHVSQTAGVDAILVHQSATTGNSIQLSPSNAANASSVLFIENPTAGAGINNVMTNTASTASSIISSNQGTGIGLDIFQINTGATTQAAVQVINNGTGANSRGVDMYLGANNAAAGYTLFHSGIGRGMYTDLNNVANASTGYDLRHAGTGRGMFMELSEASNASIGFDLRHSGTGRAMYVDLSGTGNNSSGFALYHAGTGRASFLSLTNAANAATGAAVFHAGTGVGSEVGILNTTSTSMIQSLFHDGLGRGQQILLNNAANTDVGVGIFHGGNGMGQYIGLTNTTSTGTGLNVNHAGDGDGLTVSLTNTSASPNSVGLYVNYTGNALGAGGGGNAAEFLHNGTNGNAMDVFMGVPTMGAGSSTSEHAALSVRHMATGTSPTAGLIKSAISASNNSADPAILVTNEGTEDGHGINVFVTPVLAANQARGIYAQSTGAAGAGIGIQGFGGDFGVVGSTNGGNNLGLFSTSDFAANGTKAFLIDHPLDPANKTLRHFCIESNEVLNMYRGVVELGANGQAVIELPDYFDAININPSYQLTPIGTPTQPYVLSEISNNQFIVSGAPNTKVSWTVHAQRNDPTIQYYNSTIDNYTTNVRMKRPHEIGKYFTPEAYGQSKEQGILYSAETVKNYAERDAMTKQQKGMTPSEIKPVPNAKGSIEKQEVQTPEAQKPEMSPIKERAEETVSKR